MPAPAALLGVMGNDLIHPILGQQPTPRTAVTVLSAGLTLLTILAGQLLAFSRAFWQRC
ncbi:MAG: hypothetical protein M3Y17_06980 [Actinomycetota bacterium]|nr:hypothetical protein [Actinomycetota bacterium]